MEEALEEQLCLPESGLSFIKHLSLSPHVTLSLTNWNKYIIKIKSYGEVK